MAGRSAVLEIEESEVLMLLDCTTCPGRGTACGGCFVSVMLDPTPGMPAEVVSAIGVLREAGLIGPVHLAVQSSSDTRPNPVPSVVRELRVG